MLTRQMHCKQCGASKETLDDALVIMCDFCGSFITLETAQLFSGDSMEKQTSEAMRRAVNPTKAEARWIELAQMMHQAQQDGQLGGWRTIASEYYALLPLVQPNAVPIEFCRGQRLKEWIQSTVKSAELTAFDPELSEQNQLVRDQIAGFYQAEDKEKLAAELLTSWTAFYQNLYNHPEYPQDQIRLDPADTARDVLRATVKGMESLIDPAVLKNIRQHLLGDRAAGGEIRCDNCGAQIDKSAQAAQRCPYCHGRIASSSGDNAQVEVLLGTWHMVAKALPDDEVMKVGQAINHVVIPGVSTGNPPSFETVWNFLQQAMGQCSQASLSQAISNMRPMQQNFEGYKEILDQLMEKLDQWTTS